MAYIEMSMEVDTDDLARELAWGESQETLIEFVLELDGRVGDTDFTRNLRDALNESIEDEEDN